MAEPPPISPLQDLISHVLVLVERIRCNVKDPELLCLKGKASFSLPSQKNSPSNFLYKNGDSKWGAESHTVNPKIVILLDLNITSDQPMKLPKRFSFSRTTTQGHVIMCKGNAAALSCQQSFFGW